MCSQHDAPDQHDSLVTMRRTCEAVVGYAASPYGEVRRFCGQTVALVTWSDHTGTVHAACTVHAPEVRHRWPEAVPA